MTTNTSTIDLLNEALSSGTLREISRQLGTDEQTAQQAVGAALPTLLEALSRQSAQPAGAESLHRAVGRDHDGGVLDDLLGGIQSGALSGMGPGILKHILGSRQGRVEQGISKASGLDAASAGQLLKMLAPIVLGAIGRQQRTAQRSPADLADSLRRDSERMHQQNPAGMSLIGRVLDQDGDGDFDFSDIVKLGTGLLRGLMKR